MFSKDRSDLIWHLTTEEEELVSRQCYVAGKVGWRQGTPEAEGTRDESDRRLSQQYTQKQTATEERGGQISAGRYSVSNMLHMAPAPCKKNTKKPPKKHACVMCHTAKVRGGGGNTHSDKPQVPSPQTLSQPLSFHLTCVESATSKKQNGRPKEDHQILVHQIHIAHEIQKENWFSTRFFTWMNWLLVETAVTTGDRLLC